MSQKVSVIIPAFNASRWLRRAVESCLVQTLRPCEIVIVDDGSTDDTYSVARNLTAQHDCIQVLHLNANRGPAAARHLGVMHSRGEFIAFLDADDSWLPEKLKRQVEAIERHPDAGLVITALHEVREDGSLIRTIRHHLPASREQRVLASFLFQLKMITPTMLMPRSVYDRVGGFDERLRRCEDHDLFMRIAAEYEVICLDSALVQRFVVPESASKSGSAEFLETSLIEFMNVSLERFPFLRPYAAAFRAKVNFQIGRRLQKQTNLSEARRYFIRSLRSRPTVESALAYLTTILPGKLQAAIGPIQCRRILAASFR